MSIQVSIISANLGSAPPASAGLNAHQPASPHRLDDRRGQGARPLGLCGLRPHQVPHPAGQADDAVGRFDCGRHVHDPRPRQRSAGREFRYSSQRNTRVPIGAPKGAGLADAGRDSAFDGFDALDVVAPWEVFARAATIDSGFEVAVVCAGPKPVTAAYGLQLDVVEEMGTPDALLVPGGSWVGGTDTGVPREIRRGTLPHIIADLSKSARWVASVCTGALLLGEAGILRNRNATTNPAAMEELSRYGATVWENRVVDDGNVVTAGAVTAGFAST